jgi:hypothetical protein
LGSKSGFGTLQRRKKEKNSDGEVRACEGHRVWELRSGQAYAQQRDQRARRHEIHRARTQGIRLYSSISMYLLHAIRLNC